MKQYRRGRIVGLGAVFRDLEDTLMLLLPKCKSLEAVCPCKTCKTLRAYTMFLNRLTDVAS